MGPLIDRLRALTSGKVAFSKAGRDRIVQERFSDVLQSEAGKMRPVQDMLSKA